MRGRALNRLAAGSGVGGRTHEQDAQLLGDTLKAKGLDAIAKIRAKNPVTDEARELVERGNRQYFTGEKHSAGKLRCMEIDIYKEFPTLSRVGNDIGAERDKNPAHASKGFYANPQIDGANRHDKKKQNFVEELKRIVTARPEILDAAVEKVTDGSLRTRA
eukprot:g6064.t1